jgi:nucleoside-diphosphate-sugar epimerase
MGCRTVLLTGATGHLGAAITREILDAQGTLRLRLLVRSESKLRRLAAADEAMARVMDCERVLGDIRDQPKMDQAVAGADVVIHACHSHEYWRGPRYLLDVNVGGAENLVRAIRARSAVRQVIFVGSYSAHRPGAGGEDRRRAGAWSPRECSSRSKRLAQDVLLDEAARGRFRLDIVSPTYLIGPLQLDPTYFGALFHLVLLGPLRWCPPNGINIVDVRDVAHTVVRCLDRDGTGVHRILAAGDNVALRDLFAEMNRQAGFSAVPKCLPSDLFRLVSRFRQFGAFGREYFRRNHYVEEAGLSDRGYAMSDSIRDTLAWARRSPLYRRRVEFFGWLARRYLW